MMNQDLAFLGRPAHLGDYEAAGMIKWKLQPDRLAIFIRPGRFTRAEYEHLMQLLTRLGAVRHQAAE